MRSLLRIAILGVVAPFVVAAQPSASQAVRDSTAGAAQLRATQASQTQADRALDRAVGAYAAVKTLRGTFEQTVRNPIGGETVARGTFQQQLPNRIAIQFTAPNEYRNDRIVSDGTVLWVYVPSAMEGTVTRFPVGSAFGGNVNALQDLLTNPKGRYTVSAPPASFARPGTTAVALTARTADAPFTQAIIWIDSTDALVREFQVTEGTGLVRRIRLVTLRVNEAVDQSTFRFSPPSGTRIVDSPSGH